MRGIRCQELSLQGTGHHTYTVYRGQQMSASELDQLKKCVGGTIAMTSFVSTSKTPNVAEMFAGNGEGQTDMESVIFEIIISESEYDYERSPFADISHLSSKEGEDEVLLCLGTVLQVESVEKKEPVTWVRLRMCQREDHEVLREPLNPILSAVSEDSDSNEKFSLGQLGGMLYFMDDFRKMEQVFKVMGLSRGSPTDPVIAFCSKSISFARECGEMDITDTDCKHKMLTLLGGIQTLARSVIDSRPSGDSLSYPTISSIALVNDFFPDDML